MKTFDTLSKSTGKTIGQVIENLAGKTDQTETHGVQIRTFALFTTLPSWTTHGIKCHDVGRFSEEALMSNRLRSAVLIGAISFIGTLGGSEAAVTVIGGGAAQLCYAAADSGRAGREGIMSCNEALVGALSQTDRAATLVNRGVIELNQARVNAAQDDFNAGLAIDPDLAEGYVDRGATLIAQRKFADAIKDINKGLALGAKQPQVAYFDRAIADEALGNLQAAYDDYRQALVIAPDFTLASDELKRFKVVDKPSGA
jgi:tetratricopeptide (TPR) repeat protein